MPPVPPDGNSWSAIIREFFDGVPKLTAGLKDVILALGVLYGAWATANNSGKLDAVGAKADVAAIASTTAATRAVVVEKKIDENSDSLDINTAINTKWQADRSGDPEDKAKADTAAAKVMLQHSPAAKEAP